MFSFGQQQQQPQPQTQSLFGAPNTAGQNAAPQQSLFGTQSMFSQPQQQQQQQPGLFGSQKPSTGSLFAPQSSTLGQQQFIQQQQQQPQAQSSSGILQEIEDLMAAYEPNDPRCKFRHAFYNLVNPADAPKYARPSNIPEGLWNEAVSSSPDPTCLVPVFASSFGDLQKRVQSQTGQCTSAKAKLQEVSQELEAVSDKQQVEIYARIVKCKRKNVEVALKIVRIMKNVQCLRARGHPSLTREEEALRTKLEFILQSLRQPLFRGRLQEMEAHVRMLEGQSTRVQGGEVLDSASIDSIQKVLTDMQLGLKGISDLLSQDLANVEIMETGYKQKPGENSFRSSISVATGSALMNFTK